MPTPASDLRYVYLPFVDVRKSTATTADGLEVPTRIVSGIMTDETVDLDGEIVDYDSAKKAATEWFRDWANIREQHSSNAIGTAIAMVTDDVKKEIRTTIEVVDPLAIVKIDRGVLKGQSVGLKNARKIADATAPRGRLIGFGQVEDSLVDRPSNPTAKFAVYKMAKDGSLEVGEALIHKVASADENKLATVEDGKGNQPGATAPSPLMGELVAEIEGGLNQPRTNPPGKQVELPSDTAGDDLDTAPGSALRRKKKPTPEIGGKPAGLGARQTPKDAEADAEKGSIVPGQAQPAQAAPAADGAITSPSGASAGTCANGSCSCDACGPTCTGGCCDECTMGDEYDRRETLHFGANAEYLKFVEAEYSKRDFSAGDRKRLAGEGKALPDGSFPIANEEDLHNAIRAVGRASDPAAAKKHIKARAAAMGMSDALPSEWKSPIATTTKSTSPEEALEMSYANAAPHIKAALEAGDAKAALALMQAAELIAKGSTITAQPAAVETSDEPEPVVPVSEDPAPTKAASADFTKAITSEVSKAVASALSPLKDEIEELKKRAQPGGPSLTSLRQLSAPKDAQQELLKATLGGMSIEDLQALTETHPDGQVRSGLKQILADLTKSA